MFAKAPPALCWVQSGHRVPCAEHVGDGVGEDEQVSGPELTVECSKHRGEGS